MTQPAPDLQPLVPPAGHVPRAVVALAMAFGLALPLAGCGGALGEPPSVSLVATTTSAAAGGAVTLVAAASDTTGISEVRFYRVDTGGSSLIGSLTSAPYQLTTTIPTTATGSIAYYAEAVDTDNNTTDSSQVAVAITQ